jgi:hypothetical protein
VSKRPSSEVTASVLNGKVVGPMLELTVYQKVRLAGRKTVVLTVQRQIKRGGDSEETRTDLSWRDFDKAHLQR